MIQKLTLENHDDIQEIEFFMSLKINLYSFSE